MRNVLDHKSGKQFLGVNHRKLTLSCMFPYVYVEPLQARYKLIPMLGSRYE